MLQLRNFVIAMMFASAALSGCALQSEEAGQEEASAARIQSREDLNRYLGSTSDSPLQLLSPAARQRFLDSLVFGDNGLGSFSYTDLEAELSATEIHAVLSLFGVERTTSMILGARVDSDADRELMLRPPPGGDHDGYKCESRATCGSALTYICTSNC